MHNRAFFMFRCVVLVCCTNALLAACNSAQTAALPTLVQPTPTISPLFSEPPTELPTIVPSAVPTAPIRPTSATAPGNPTAQTASTAPTAANAGLVDIPIYDDNLLATWTISGTANMRVDLGERKIIHAGRRAIRIEPFAGTGKFQLSVGKNIGTGYRRDKVVAVSFWVSGGAVALAPNDLTVSVLGSNTRAYFIADDTSVPPPTTITPESPLFPETRLYYLGFNSVIPANQWAEVLVYLDELQFDPTYTYVTGVYFKNDDQRTAPIYIDSIHLLVKP